MGKHCNIDATSFVHTNKIKAFVDHFAYLEVSIKMKMLS